MRKIAKAINTAPNASAESTSELLSGQRRQRSDQLPRHAARHDRHLDGEEEPEIVATAGWASEVKGKPIETLPRAVIDRLIATSTPVVIEDIAKDPLFAKAAEIILEPARWSCVVSRRSHQERRQSDRHPVDRPRLGPREQPMRRPLHEFRRERDAAGRVAPPVWFALDESRPLAFFAGIWTRWTSVRKVKEGETTNDLFAEFGGSRRRQLSPGPRRPSSGRGQPLCCAEAFLDGPQRRVQGGIEEMAGGNGDADEGDGRDLLRRLPLARHPLRLLGLFVGSTECTDF